MKRRASLWWENDFLTKRRGKLYLGARSAEEVARKHGTPLFCYGRDRIKANYQRLKKVFDFSREGFEVRLSYAMKANPNRGILKTLRSEDAWIDAVSPAEVEEARAAGFPSDRILYTGTSVSREDLERVMAVEGLVLNIDALEQLDIMRDVARQGAPRRAVRVSIRWNPGIGGGFNPKVVTAGKTTPSGIPIKFGLDESKVLAAFQKAVALGFKPVGLHQHLGSGWVKEDFKAVRAAVEKMVKKAAQLERDGFDLEFLDFGGGFGPRYRPDQKVFPLERYAALIRRTVTRAGLGVRTVCVEPGRFLVADAGVLLIRVEYVKESYGQFFACVNAGTFNSVARPAIYTEASHPILNASRLAAGAKKRLTVAGNLCESADVFGKNILLPLPRTGDILAVLLAGAYCRSMASHFNLREIPPEILL